MTLDGIQDRSDYKRQMRDLLEIDAARTALVTIDMQHNYLDPSVGALPLPAEDADRVIEASAALFDEVRERGIPVIHVYTVRRQLESDRGFSMAGVAMMREARAQKLSQLPHAEVSPLPDRLAGSPQAELIASLVRPGDLHLTSKKTMDAFQYTELEMLLDRVLEADTVLLAGINTDTCVYSTTFSAANRGYRPVVLSECVGSTRGRDSHLMALEVMARSIAWVLDNEQLRAKLAPAAVSPR